MKYVCHQCISSNEILSVSDIFRIQNIQQQKLGDVDEPKDGSVRNSIKKRQKTLILQVK